MGCLAVSVNEAARLLELAEQGFSTAVQVMLDEIHRLLEKRQEALARGKTQLPDREEAKFWRLVERVAVLARFALELSVKSDILHRVEVPIIPPEVVAQLRALVPGREALAALDARGGVTRLER
jgi:hypothetical protein